MSTRNLFKEMIEQFRKMICSRQDIFPGVEQGSLSFTKFCQRITGPDTKVLFFVTHKSIPICIIKVIREESYDNKLQNEAQTQKSLIAENLEFVPKVYFDGSINGRYFYAEEVMEGRPLSKRDAQKNTQLIIDMIKSLPTKGLISSAQTREIFQKLQIKDKNFVSLLDVLGKGEVVLKTGVTHGDFGLPNLIKTPKGIAVIDWGRANEKPFWLIDAVYFLVRVETIRDVADWERRGSSTLTRYGHISAAEAKSLYCISMLFEILYKRYPAEYIKAVENMRTI